MKKWLKSLLMADSFVLLGMGMITPIYAIFVQEIGGDILEASSAWALFALSSGILMYFLGKWEDRQKHYAKMLFIGYTLRALGFLGYFFVSNMWQLFGIQIVIGISMAVGTPSYDALYSKFLDKGEYASEWAMWEAMNMIVTAIAALVGGGIAGFFGFKTLFIIMFLSGIAGAVISFPLISREKQVTNRFVQI